MRFSFLLSFILLPLLNYASDPFSLITTPIILKKDETRLAQGTGFYFLHQDRLFLVTALHVLTGHPPSEKKKPAGNKISFYCHLDSPKGEKVRWIDLEHQALWISPATRIPIDIAIIPMELQKLAPCKINAATQDWIIDPVELSPASVVCLVGYPYGYSDRLNALPVWKTGNLASSPGVDFEDLPLVLLDISIFPGMSGAPALQIVRDSDGATKAQLVGIFGSMVERKQQEREQQGAPLSLELVQVWKAKLLLDLVNHYLKIDRSERGITAKRSNSDN